MTEMENHIAELDQLKRERDELIDVLRRHGFRRCDIAACNCNSWHHVEGYAARFREFDDALNEAGFSTNGRTALDALKAALTQAALAVPAPV